ncbi:MAG TPA: phosphopyruvate hydratase [Bacillota bacterium]|nr:phosphopyruvate hydratase [Bacillota bacterium]
MNTSIRRVAAREILDSRGHPTLEVEVELAGGSAGKAAVPSGASTGSHEARELRDGDPRRYRGRGMVRAVAAVQGELARAVAGRDAVDQQDLDAVLRAADGTPLKERLGANALLGISLAAARAAALARGLPLYRHIAELAGNPRQEVVLPVPLLNVINGGRHADSGVQIQEFMLAPVGAPSFAEAMRWSVEVYHILRDILLDRGLAVGVGDEGGFAPALDRDEEALALLTEAVEAAGLIPGRDVRLAIDAAASEFHRDGRYHLTGRPDLGSGEMIGLYRSWAETYALASVEDGLAEDDWEGWQELTRVLGRRVQLVGDDLFVTNPVRLQEGLSRRAANAILIKPNQIGTLSETLETMALARSNGYPTVVSHRSGETEDTFIADLAVGTAAGQIKTGAPCRGERVAKYNRLLAIEEAARDAAQYALPGMSALW